MPRRRYELTETEWAIIERLPPNKPRRTTRVDDRRVINASFGGFVRALRLEEFLRNPTRRGLRGVKLVVSDAHIGIKGAVSKVFGVSTVRCSAPCARNRHFHV